MELLPIDSQGRLCQRALDEYALSLKSLDAVKPLKKLRVDSVLSVLIARDEVERTIGADGCERSVGSVRRLIALDDRLCKSAGRMVRVVKARELGGGDLSGIDSGGSGEGGASWYRPFDDDLLDDILDAFEA